MSKVTNLTDKFELNSFSSKLCLLKRKFFFSFDVFNIYETSNELKIDKNEFFFVNIMRIYANILTVVISSRA